MAPSRILLLQTSSERGGAELVNLALWRQLHNDFSFEIGFLDNQGALADAYQGSANAPWHLNAHQQPIWRVVFQLRQRLIEREIGLIHTHGQRAALVASLASWRLPNVSHVHTYHNTTFATTWQHRLLLQWIARHIDHHIVVSNSVGNVLRKAVALGDGQLTEIYPGVDTGRFTPKDPTPPSPPLHIPANTPLLLSAANLRHPRTQEWIIEALATSPLNEIEPLPHLLLAGFGERLNFLRTVATKYNIAERVHFLGGRTDIPALLAAADLLIHTTKHEGFGLILVEAMAAGCPIVATRVDAISELIDDGINGILVQPQDIEALSIAIHALLQNQDKRAQMGQQGRVKANTHFSIELCASKHQALYDAYIHEHPIRDTTLTRHRRNSAPSDNPSS